MIQGSLVNQSLNIGRTGSDVSTWTVLNPIELLSGYMPVFVAAFVVTLIVTPIVRRIAIAADIIDHPDKGQEKNKQDRIIEKKYIAPR